MKSVIIALFLSVCFGLVSTPLAVADMGERGPPRPKAPKAEPEEEPPGPLDEQWKWLLAAFVVLLVGYTGWRFWSESTKVRPMKERKPWEFE